MLFKVLLGIAVGVFLVLSFVHQKQDVVDRNCDDLTVNCTKSGVSYELYWKPIWNPLTSSVSTSSAAAGVIQ